jgi:hypothetical protein
MNEELFCVHQPRTKNLCEEKTPEPAGRIR